MNHMREMVSKLSIKVFFLNRFVLFLKIAGDFIRLRIDEIKNLMES